MTVTLAALYIYPVKSCAEVRLDAARAEPRGLAGDRRWALVGPDGRLLTQRELPRMRLIEPVWDGTLRGLRAPGLPDLPLPAEATGPRVPATLWGEAIGGLRVSPEAEAWLEAFLDAPCDLVALPADASRWQEGKPFRAPLGYADGNPYHLISTTSLDTLGDASRSPLDFRPNLVVEGALPFAEDGWRRVQVGPVGFQVVESCARCSVVNVDPGGRMTAEPLRTLARHRRRGHAILFGQHLILEGTPGLTLTVGDSVTVLDWSPEPNPSYG
ncbi:hypothetical protein HNQ07_002041 [Deinococcus metalli]|uniref:Molybdenum cofactor sulfurase n=1 Tax=Deinococcus metalli TaxID=1141878 RepID=A0A7W8KE97_9DEIO|nr:MOSC N-terminal beta barrel domain-containing protein [Deinococcus metalli]MBB5376577.1 hypothetical protein [Deinococcus metalli]GHF43015.1 molybdenum cofactor sulfurase [Deinococcus metalli]